MRAGASAQRAPALLFNAFIRKAVLDHEHCIEHPLPLVVNILATPKRDHGWIPSAGVARGDPSVGCRAKELYDIVIVLETAPEDVDEKGFGVTAP